MPDDVPAFGVGGDTPLRDNVISPLVTWCDSKKKIHRTHGKPTAMSLSLTLDRRMCQRRYNENRPTQCGNNWVDFAIKYLECFLAIAKRIDHQLKGGKI